MTTLRPLLGALALTALLAARTMPEDMADGLVLSAADTFVSAAPVAAVANAVDAAPCAGTRP